jgi:DeoR family fructose operon transcriptional repressor
MKDGGSMIPYVRRKKILAELGKKEIVYISDLEKTLPDISEATIRRDLKALEEEGYVELLRGGAAKLRTWSYDIPLQTKERLHIQEKDRIARYAASLVDDGEVIYIDSGSTTLQMVKYLKDKQIEVVTSSTQIVNVLHECKFSCILLGGEVNISIGSISGTITERQLSELFFDKAFLGASGYTLKGGINTPDLREATKKRLVMEHSQKTYVLMDDSKANKQTLCKALDFDECIILTDETNELLETTAEFIVVP